MWTSHWDPFKLKEKGMDNEWDCTKFTAEYVKKKNNAITEFCIRFSQCE